MKKQIIVCSFLLLSSLSKIKGQELSKTAPREQTNKEISFTILSTNGPSWPYSITSKQPITVDVNVMNAEYKLVSSEKITIENSRISKLNVYHIATEKLYVEIVNDGKVIYKGEFKKSLTK
jgi:hypothetical protein